MEQFAYLLLKSYHLLLRRAGRTRVVHNPYLAHLDRIIAPAVLRDRHISSGIDEAS